MSVRRTMMLSAAAVCACLAAVPSLAAQQKVRVKFATLAPDGSPWHRILEDMGHEWQQGTQGRVRLVIYPGGVAGDDQAALRKIRHGQLQGAGLTVSGLSDLDPAFNLFLVPLFFESIEEFFYVLDRLGPVLAERLEERGFVLLNWVYAGWIHIFARRRLQTVEELKRLKMYTGASDDELIQLWRQNGFNPVGLSPTDIMMGLQSGMIDGLPAPPLGALAMQWFKHVPYMIDPGFSPLIGAAVVDAGTWMKISEEDRAAILEAAGRAAARLAAEIPQKDEESILEMEKRGLEVIRLRPGDEQDPWLATAESFAESMRRTMVPDEIFDLAVRYRAEYRAGRPGER